MWLRDEANATILVSHHYEDAEVLTVGHIFIIKEPYFTITSDGEYYMRVDHITDLIPIFGRDERVPLTLSRDDVLSSFTSAELKREGDMQVGKRKFLAAAFAQDPLRKSKVCC